MAHFDERNIVSEHGTWAVTHQGIAALDYAMFFSADMLEVIAHQPIDLPPFVDEDDFLAAVEAGLAYHGTTEEREAEQFENMKKRQDESIEYAQEVHPVDDEDSDVVESESNEENDHKPFNEMTKAELKAYADENGIEYPSGANKSELREAVENA